MDRVEAIRSRIEQALSPQRVEIVDESHKHAGHAGAAGGGGHFAVTIVSSRFEGRSTIERHRMVYLAVTDLMPQAIHALSIQARTPKEAGEPSAQ